MCVRNISVLLKKNFHRDLDIFSTKTKLSFMSDQNRILSTCAAHYATDCLEGLH